ncbi:MAG: LytTR family DNA-binding domain-containing protein [Pseudomonadales bacterium]
MKFSFWKQLNQPFPQRRAGLKSLIDAAATGLFVAAFLFVLQPFDMSRSGIPPLTHSLAYGLVTFVVNLIYDWFCYKVLKLQTDIDSWTLLKWLTNVTGLILCIAIGNFLYFNYSFDWQYFNLSAFGQALFKTLVVGVFPTIAFGLILQLRAAKTNVQSAAEIDSSTIFSRESSADPELQKEEKLRFGSHSADEVLVDASALRYIEAMQNYVSVCTIEDNKITRHLVRQTLSNAAKQCAGTRIVRCHRSFLVNTVHIETVSGNAQGLKLELSDVDDAEIPVSRSYIAELQQILEANN